MASNHAVSGNTRSSSRREAGMKKEDEAVISAAADATPHNKRRGAEKKKQDEVALIPAAASASHNKRRRAEKKKQNEVALIPAAAAAPKKSEIAEKKKKFPITVNKKIPQGNPQVVTPRGIQKFNMHTFLAGKKIVLYGLPAYFDPVVHQTHIDTVMKMRRWRPFYQDRVMKPALEFIKQAKVLTDNGVNEIVFFTANLNVLVGAYKNLEIITKYEYVKFMWGAKSYLGALGLEMDIPQEGMPPRSRRFILLVDDLKVKFANIESIDAEFIIPSAEEIIKAFDQ